MHVPHRNRMQYCVSVGSLDNVSRTPQSTGIVPEDISEEHMQSLRSLWIIFMTASQASTEGKSRSKRTRNLSSIPPNRAALVNHAKREVFQGGFVWTQTCPEGASVTMSFLGGWQPAGIVWIPHWTTLQEVNDTCYEVIHCWCKMVSRGGCNISVLKEVWHAQVCATVVGNCN